MFLRVKPYVPLRLCDPETGSQSDTTLTVSDGSHCISLELVDLP